MTAIDADVTLRAAIEEFGARKTIVRTRVYSGDTLTAEGEVIAASVTDSW